MENMKPMFPQIKLNLNSPSGNAFEIIGTVKRALETAGITNGMITSILEEMKSSDYGHLCEIAGQIITLYRSDTYEG